MVGASAAGSVPVLAHVPAARSESTVLAKTVRLLLLRVTDVPLEKIALINSLATFHISFQIPKVKQFTSIVKVRHQGQKVKMK